jgi:hypothetical protein
MKYELKVFRKLTKKVINIIFNEKYFRQQYNFIKNIKFKIGRRSHCQRPDIFILHYVKLTMKKSPISGEFWNYQFDGKIDKEVFYFWNYHFFQASDLGLNGTLVVVWKIQDGSRYFSNQKNNKRPTRTAWSGHQRKFVFNIILEAIIPFQEKEISSGRGGH